MEIKFKKLRENAVIPQRGSSGAAGTDLCACIEDQIIINPGETVMIPIGLAMELPAGYFGAVFARSGLASKEGIRPANCVGVCDEDYRGEYMVPLHNDSASARKILPGQKVAQLIVMQYMQIQFVEVKELEETDRGDSGFGSTGK